MEQVEVTAALASARRALAQNRSDEAFNVLVALVKSVPDDPEVFSLLGIAHASRKDYAHALDCFRKSLTLQPSARTHYNVANLYRIQGYLAPARRALREALKLDPGYRQAEKMLYELEEAQG